ncbi:MAG: bifunctional phosphopantothenoylcysteine decarboxylase/phosphopantothenate--cysteine ligase CoaBC [Sulfuricella sp.]|nr:bifunctional phosphopantothenoylcysteine decarboxylase/phosphopantothenate--cysteine ligase CoaBC [Sulfuricella sp.]
MAENHSKRILLGITGGIAAYKAADLTRLLKRGGYEVQVAMTEAACRFVAPATFQALSGKPVFTDLWDERAAGGMAHIALTRGFDAALIAPTSADFLAKLAHGLADDLLSTLCLARACPLLVAPAMNREMWENPATQRNVAQLARDGVTILGPGSGEQACGETGQGRMLEPQELADALNALWQPKVKVLQGRKVLITAGPTVEAIDPVRGITNASSGKMGYAVAQAALDAGAEVVLVSGPTCLTPPAAARTIAVKSALEMLAAVEKQVAGCDIFIAVAAVADYRVAHPRDRKIKKDGQPLTLELLPNPDILATIAARPDAPFCVGFAAESEDLHENAEAKRRRKKLPLIAANLAQDAIGNEENQLVLFDDRGVYPLLRAAKPVQARWLVEHIAKLYSGRN